MARRLYILTGAPGSGKSTLLAVLPRIRGLTCQVVPKITTRRRRRDDGSEILPVEHTNAAPLPSTAALLDFVQKHAAFYSYDSSVGTLTVRGPLPHEELQKIKKALVAKLPERRRGKALREIESLAKRANTFPQRYDLIYEQYNVRYGLASSELISLLCAGISPVAIVNDIRVLRELRSMFGQQAVFIFVFSPLESIDVEQLQTARAATDATGGIDKEQILRRAEKAKVILRRYIENIELFDHVIINHRRSRLELLRQMRGIVMRRPDRFQRIVVKEDLTE